MEKITQELGDLRRSVDHLAGELSGLRSQTKDDLAELRSQTKEELAKLRSQMATKDDLAKLRSQTKDDLAELRSQMATKDDLAKLRSQVHEDQLHLYATVRGDMHQMQQELMIHFAQHVGREIASHMGTIEEHLSGRFDTFEERWEGRWQDSERWGQRVVEAIGGI